MLNAWHRLAIAVLLLIVTIGVTACGGGNPGTAATESAVPPPSATENQIKATPRDQIRDGGKLTWPIESMPSNLNYYQLDGTEQDGHFVFAAMMPSLVRADAGGATHWDLDYLAAPPTLVTDPVQVVTYQLNPKAIWYDGTPITWQDLYWQWQATNGVNKAYQISSSNGYQDIESIARGRDDHEVIVTFKRKYADWRSLFYPFYPASTNRSPTVFNEGWKDHALTSAGPFRLAEINQTAKTITLVRNEKWWGAPAKLDSIVYRVIDTDAQVDALANGEVDGVDVGPDANKFSRARAIANVDLRIAGGPNFRHLTINGSGGALQDVRVRRAMALAIDRAAIARAMLGPLGIETVPLNNHIFMRNQVGYRDNAGELGQYDPMKAGRLLDEAGWSVEGGVRTKQGKPLEIRCVIPSAIATSKQEAELVQNMLGQIGVRMTIDVVPSPDFFDQYVSPGQFDFTVFSWMGTAFPISSKESVYAKPTLTPSGEMAIQQNYARIGSDEIDGLYRQVGQELDPQKAIDIANRIDGLIWQEVHSLTLYQRPEIWAVKKDLVNFGAFGFADIVYQDIGWAAAPAD